MSVGPIRKRLREKARAGVPFVSSPFPVTPATHVSRTCLDLKATPGDRASFLFLAL